MIKMNSKQLRVSLGDEGIKKQLKHNPIYIILDNVLDTYNIGAIFRLADGVAAQKVILCAGSETPPNSRIKKASINTTEWVDWEYYSRTVDAITKLREEVPAIQIVAVEQDSRSVPFQQMDYVFPLALVVGHETDGVSKEVLEMCDSIVELPMYGVNISLNVMVSLGIVLYKVLESLEKGGA